MNYKKNKYNLDNLTNSLRSLSINSISNDEELVDDDNEYRHKKLKKHKKEYNKISIINYEPFGQTTNLGRYTPFINNLINKKISYHNGVSNHIAVFILSSCNRGIDLSTMCNGRVIVGENSDRPLYSNNKMTTHAEMDALIKVDSLIRCKKLKKNSKLNLIVIRINKHGSLRESAPCFHCTKELAKRNNIIIDKLYFSRTNESITCIKFDKYINNFTPYISRGWKDIKST